MGELKEILLGILVLIYGITFYIVGRTNFLEKVIIYKINELLENNAQTDDMRKEDEGK